MFVVLSIGLVFGLKHATEVDHVVAISTIVSRHRNVFRSAIVGGLWGVGHTVSLLVIGAIVLSLRIAIPEDRQQLARVCGRIDDHRVWDQCALACLAKEREVHIHQHNHDGVSHSHVHFHEKENKHQLASHAVHSHTVSRLGWKPVLIGMVHGLAGSGALTLLVLTQISSSLLGFLYVLTFGFGSIVGMLLMSGLIGLPFAFTSRKLTHLHDSLQTLAAVFSICFGIWYAYKAGAGGSLF